MGKGRKVLTVLLAVLLCVSVIWGAYLFIRQGELSKELNELQERNEQLSITIAESEGKDTTITQLQESNAALEEQVASLTNELTLSQTAQEEAIETAVEERYPQLVEENARLKAQLTSQMGESLLQEETDAANEG